MDKTFKTFGDARRYKDWMSKWYPTRSYAVEYGNGAYHVRRAA
jgi:hypothetical protein